MKTTKMIIILMITTIICSLVGAYAVKGKVIYTPPVQNTKGITWGNGTLYQLPQNTIDNQRTKNTTNDEQKYNPINLTSEQTRQILNLKPDCESFECQGPFQRAKMQILQIMGLKPKYSLEPSYLYYSEQTLKNRMTPEGETCYCFNNTQLKLEQVKNCTFYLINQTKT
jgi:hypothetical protein